MRSNKVKKNKGGLGINPTLRCTNTDFQKKSIARCNKISFPDLKECRLAYGCYMCYSTNCHNSKYKYYLVKKNWIEWFVGFCDAEGNFQV